MPYLDFSARNGIFRMWYTETTNQAANTSTITIDRCQFASTNYYGSVFYGDGIIQINGTTLVTLKDSGVYVGTQNDYYDIPGSAGSQSIVISHNADGTGSFTVTLKGRPGVYNDMNMFCNISAGGSWEYNGSVYPSLTPIARQFTLSVSAGTGSNITVKRNGTTIYGGATVTYGDVLTITFGANTGYNLGTHTVNGSTFTSGNTHTVTAAVSVISTATLKSFLLSTNIGRNTSLTVNRTSSPLGGGSTGVLSYGATIYYNDVLKITFGVTTGCVLTTHTVNGIAFTSGNSHTVTAAVSVVSAATVNSYALSMSSSGRITLTVNRTSSPLQGAAQGYLSNGATIYYGDVLSVAFEVSTGSTLSVHTIDGVNFNSGYAHTVTAAVAVVVSATLNEYQITRSVGVGVSLVIQRTASPYGHGTIGVLTGDTVYYGDELQLTVQASSGYAIDSMKINQVPYYDNPHTVTVVNALLITILAAALGFVRIDSGAAIEKYKILIDSGSAYEQYRAMIDTGSEIVPY